MYVRHSGLPQALTLGRVLSCAVVFSLKPSTNENSRHDREPVIQICLKASCYVIGEGCVCKDWKGRRRIRAHTKWLSYIPAFWQRLYRQSDWLTDWLTPRFGTFWYAGHGPCGFTGTAGKTLIFLFYRVLMSQTVIKMEMLINDWLGTFPETNAARIASACWNL